MKKIYKKLYQFDEQLLNWFMQKPILVGIVIATVIATIGATITVFVSITLLKWLLY